MAKISELTAASAITTDDLIVVVDDLAGSPTTKSATAQKVVDLVASELLPSEPDDGDILTYDSGTSSWVSITLADLKAALDALDEL
jgi:hypothetical protein